MSSTVSHALGSRPSARLLHWPTIVASLAVAILFIAALLHVMKSRRTPRAAEPMAQLAPHLTEPRQQDTFANSNDGSDEVRRVLGSGMEDAAREELLAPAPSRSRPRPATPEPTMRPPLLTVPTPPPPAHSARDEAFEKRLHRSEAQLRERLRDVPEVRPFGDTEIQALRDVQSNSDTLRSRGVLVPVNRAFNEHLQLAFRQAALKEGLPLQTGRPAQLDPGSAATMARLSRGLRDMGFVSLPGVEGRVRSTDGAIVPVRGTTLAGGSAPQKVAAFKSWCERTEIGQYRGALTTLLQMLQVEDAPTRLLLVKELNKVESPATGAVLALRAAVDLSADVREAAIEALRTRPAKQYLPVLLLGLRYPWKPAADHAAYALMKLKPEGAIPKLLDLLDQPDPSRPVLDKKTDKWMVKELVRLNHLRNCMLCHPASLSGCDSPVSGAVPTPGRLLLAGGYVAGSANCDFVRADITFLRQDFSVVLPMRDAAPWPDEQRFDFVTRLRPATDDEVIRPAPRSASYPQREAMLYALRKLSGKDGGDDTRTWRELLAHVAPLSSFRVNWYAFLHARRAAGTVDEESARPP